MSKFQDFYAKVLADESSKNEISSILAGKPLEAASDEQLEKIGAVAKRLGFDITLAEVRDFIKKGDKKLSDDDLDAVAGGKGGGAGPSYSQQGGDCKQGVGTTMLNF